MESHDDIVKIITQDQLDSPGFVPLIPLWWLLLQKIALVSCWQTCILWSLVTIRNKRIKTKQTLRTNLVNVHPKLPNNFSFEDTADNNSDAWNVTRPLQPATSRTLPLKETRIFFFWFFFFDVIMEPISSSLYAEAT